MKFTGLPFNLPVIKIINFLSLGTVFFFHIDFSFSQVTFSGDWEKGITGNGNWKSIQAVSSNRLQRVTTPLRQGQYSARIEVRPGDDPINSSGERSEVLTMTDGSGNSISENESSGTQYYAFSFRLDPAWKAPAPDPNGYVWAIIFQLHGPDVLGTSPAFAVSVLNGLSISLHTGDLDSPSNSNQYKNYSLSDNSLNPGKWIDLVIKIKWAKDFSGSLTVWRRNEGQVSFAQVLALSNVPTLQYKSSMGATAGDHYWKHGLYRSKQTSITNILWLDGLTRGNTYNEVVCAAFGCVATWTINTTKQNDPLLIYPNPFGTEFTLKIQPETALGESTILNIYDVTGKEVRSIAINSYETTIERGELQSGIYFYQVINDGDVIANGKLSVQ